MTLRYRRTGELRGTLTVGQHAHHDFVGLAPGRVISPLRFLAHLVRVVRRPTEVRRVEPLI